MSLVQVFLCTRESYQQLRELNLLMIGCNTQYKGFAGVI
jgi:hypothetical protein